MVDYTQSAPVEETKQEIMELLQLEENRIKIKKKLETVTESFNKTLIKAAINNLDKGWSGEPCGAPSSCLSMKDEIERILAL